jgi:hypothetical protein
LVLRSGERINVDVVAAASTRHVGKLADYCCILAENGNRLLEAGWAFFVPLIEQYRPDWLSTERRGIVRNGSRGIPREISGTEKSERYLEKYLDRGQETSAKGYIIFRSRRMWIAAWRRKLWLCT